MEDDASQSRLFHLGLNQFNEQHFFDAHETWEELWHLSSGDDRRFYQGLIQLAVTLVHLQRGNPRGVRNVWTTAQTKFQGLPALYRGVPVVQLLAAMEVFLAPVLAMPEEAFAPGYRSGGAMPVDWRLTPTILLQTRFDER